MVKRELRVVNGKVPQHTSSHFLSIFTKDLDLRRITLTSENEPSMQAFREAMNHACVEVAVREMKKTMRRRLLSRSS